MKTKLLRTFVALLLTTLATVTAWAADTEAPTVSNKKITVTKIDYNSISISWEKATDNLTQQEDLVYTVTYRSATRSKSDIRGEYKTAFSGKNVYSCTISSLWKDTEYEIIVSVRDKANNSTSYETIIAKTKADTTPPTISVKDIINTRFERIMPDWNHELEHYNKIKIVFFAATDDSSWLPLDYNNNKFYYKKVNESDYHEVTQTMAYHRRWTSNDEFLALGYELYDFEPGTYDILVEVHDDSGNKSRYNPVRVTVPETSSNAPTIPDPYIRLSNITSKSVDISWNKAIDAETHQSNLYYRVGRSIRNGTRFWQVSGVEGKDMTSAKVNNQTPNTWIDLCVEVIDEDVNISTYETVSVKTMPLDYDNDKEAPTLSNKKLTVSNATDNSLTLNWTKAKDNLFDDEDLSYTVAYKLPSDARYSRDGVEQGNNISSSLVTGLSPNTTYEFRVTVKDRVGNTSTYDILTYTTSNAQDKTAPTISNKTVTATDVTYGSVALAWNKATDNVTKQENLQYSVYCDGVLCTKLKGETSYIVGDLKPSTRYTFEVRVEDEAGNVSKYNTVQATTTAKPVTVTKYPLFIEGTQVTSANANDFWGDGGTIKYDPTTKTLHLNWADLGSTSNTLEINDDITINLVGWTTISGNIYAASSSKVTIKADDKYGENAQLKIQNGYFYGNCDLTIKNECTVEIDATNKGNTAGLILNSHQLSVYGSTLKVKGDGKNATLSGISALSMTDCRITSDHKYAAASKTFLNASGGVAKDDVVISTEIIRVPVLVNDEIEVEDVTEDGALLSWVEATDDDTPQSDLDYTLYTMRRYGDTDYTGYASGRNLTSCKLYNLQPNTEYYAIVRVADKDRNFTFYKETSFKTLPESDKTAPTLANGSINVTDVTYSSASISWAKASDNVTAQDKLYYMAGYKKSSEPETGMQLNVYNAVAYGNDMTSCTIENLDPETSYDFYVVVYDEASNGAAYTKTTVVTEALPDVTAPSLGEVTISVDDLTQTSISLSWSHATDDRTPQDKLVYTVEYRKAGESAWNTINAGNANAYTIDALTEDTDYEVSIKVADEAGNETSYGGFTITTLPVPDVTAPTLADSKIVVGAVTDSSISISWTAASDDRTTQDKLEYIVECTDVATSTTTEYSAGNANQYDITGLEPNTSYSINVIVKDEVGNFNRYDAVEARTNETPDVTAPIVVDSEICVDEVTDNSISISWTAATDDRTAEENLMYTIEYKVSGTSAMTTIAIGNATSYTITDLLPATTYVVVVTVDDEAGNTASYQEQEIQTLDPDGILQIMTDNPDAKMYNIQGLNVGKGYRGLVIVNGKKYLKTK